jgi:hypothetical protein
VTDEGVQAFKELRNLLHIATLAVTAIKLGSAGKYGSPTALTDRSLLGMRSLFECSIAALGVASMRPACQKPISLAAFIDEVRLTASLEAHVSRCIHSHPHH